MSLPSTHPRLLKRPFSLGELVADGIVHSVALVAGVIGFAVLLTRVTIQGNLTAAFAVGVYAAGFFLMFGFSLAYNMTPPSNLKWVLRRFDHSSIYLMIAGTYTALLVHFQDQIWSWTLAVDHLDRRARRRRDQAVPARSLRPALDRLLRSAGRRRSGGHRAGVGVASDADPYAGRAWRADLCGRGGVLQMAQPAVSQRDLARLSSPSPPGCIFRASPTPSPCRIEAPPRRLVAPAT